MRFHGDVLAAWRDGWRRVRAAPAVAAGVFVLTFVLALPLALTLRGLLEAHLGESLMADQAADEVNYDWWQEFGSQATGLGTTFSPAIIGFASTLDTIGSVLDRQAPVVPVAAFLALYVAAWTFLVGGVLERYARQRPLRAHGFFAACGAYFFRFLRLGAMAGVVYWWLFVYVHPWLFADVYAVVTRGLGAERAALLWRAGFSLLFGALLMGTNVVLDYAKIRGVVEDRRSMVGALLAALRFIARHPGRALGLYAANSAMFLAAVALWAAIAPGAGGPGLSLWLGLALSQTYLFARLVLKLHFLASQTALFQASLAHATCAAAPASVWPDSAAAEAIGRA